MGVLGWPPKTVMQDASLEDIRDALAGFRRYHTQNESGGRPPPLSTLQALMHRFPDNPEHKGNI